MCGEEQHFAAPLAVISQFSPLRFSEIFWHAAAKCHNQVKASRAAGCLQDSAAFANHWQMGEPAAVATFCHRIKILSSQESMAHVQLQMSSLNDALTKKKKTQ